LMGEWLEAMEAEVSPEYHASFRMWAKVHWLPFFETPDRLTLAALADYQRARLARVSRVTVRKERSGLRRLLGWAHERGYIAEPLVPPPLPVKALGRRVQTKRRVDLTEEAATRLLAALPERTSQGNPARAFYTAMWETGLRRATLRRLSAPEHYRKGASELVIEDAIDKSRYGRVLPLSDAARAALDSVCPDVGLLFGRVDYRHTLALAAKTAEIEGGENLSDHDFRHARLTLWGQQTTNLLGMSFLAGHKHATTTAQYMHAKRKAADEVLAMGRRKGRGPRPSGKGRKR
jgi:integrase